MIYLRSNSLHIIFLLSLAKFYAYTKATGPQAYCNTATNYTFGSAYEQNLNLTLSFLVSNVSLNGFSNVTVGQNQNKDVVYGRLQCKGDVSSQCCEACGKTAAADIREFCPNQKEASVLDQDCSLQYSDKPLSSEADIGAIIYLWNIYNASDPVLFSRQLGNLLRNLSSIAASSSSKLATGRTEYTDFQNIQAMAQCRRDSEESSCLSCLQEITSQIPSCCGGRVGAQIITMGCNLRYENYTFLLSPPAPPPPESGSSPPPQSPELNLAGAETTNSTSNSVSKSSSRKIVIVAVPTAVASIMIFVIGGFLLWKSSRSKKIDDVHIEDGTSINSLSIELSVLKLATKNFSDANKLGQGGFGPVYKGELTDGREVAVKRLSSTSRQGLAELKTEVMLVAKLLHRNLVRLLGFCLEDEEKLLVYEYLPNGSLDKIAFDFGMAKLFPGSQTHGNTNRIAGTYGYMAPEYIKSENFSVKSDVYSFGILVLELVTGRKNSSFRNSINLQSYAWHHWRDGTALEVMDSALGDQFQREEVLKCIHIGLLCVQDAASDRPTMSDIVMMLNSQSLTCPAPSRPAFFVPKDRSSDLRVENPEFQSDQSVSQVPQQSLNDVTITDLDPR